MQTPTISLIIPVYNSAKTLNYLLESLQKQTVSADEIIICYTQSQDNSLQIIEDYKNQSTLPIIIKSLPPDKKIGPSAARNFAANFASSDLLAFTDADCLLPPNWIENLKHIFKTTNYTAVCGPVSGAEPTNILELYQCIYGLNIILEDQVYTKFELFKSFGHTANFCVQRSVFNLLKGFDENLRYAEDHDFCAKLLSLNYATTNTTSQIVNKNNNEFSNQKHQLFFTNILGIKHIYRETLNKYIKNIFGYNQAHWFIIKKYYDSFTIKFNSKTIFSKKSKFHFYFILNTLNQKILCFVLLSIIVHPLMLIALLIYFLKLNEQLKQKFYNSRDTIYFNTAINKIIDDYTPMILLTHLLTNFIAGISEIYGFFKNINYEQHKMV